MHVHKILLQCTTGGKIADTSQTDPRKHTGTLRMRTGRKAGSIWGATYQQTVVAGELLDKRASVTYTAEQRPGGKLQCPFEGCLGILKAF